jgi:predicted transcriptional regulator YdeE
MNLIKKLILHPILKSIIKNNIVSEHVVIDIEEVNCIGYSIETSFNKKKLKIDIPPFYHDVYDHDKLADLREENDDKMYCVFDFHDNRQDFTYHVSTENKQNINDDNFSYVTLNRGKYVKVEFMKRNQKAAALVAAYTIKFWLESNGYEQRKSPAFILYDKRFHENYKKHGCDGPDYLGDPIATLHVPIQS